MYLRACVLIPLLLLHPLLLQRFFGSILVSFWVPSLDEIILSHWCVDNVFTVDLSIAHRLTHLHMRTHMRTHMQTHLHAPFKIMGFSSDSLRIVYALGAKLSFVDWNWRWTIWKPRQAELFGFVRLPLSGKVGSFIFPVWVLLVLLLFAFFPCDKATL